MCAHAKVHILQMRRKTSSFNRPFVVTSACQAVCDGQRGAGIALPLHLNSRHTVVCH